LQSKNRWNYQKNIKSLIKDTRISILSIVRELGVSGQLIIKYKKKEKRKPIDDYQKI